MLEELHSTDFSYFEYNVFSTKIPQKVLNQKCVADMRSSDFLFAEKTLIIAEWCTTGPSVKLYEVLYICMFEPSLEVRRTKEQRREGFEKISTAQSWAWQVSWSDSPRRTLKLPLVSRCYKSHFWQIIVQEMLKLINSHTHVCFKRESERELSKSYLCTKMTMIS